MSIQAAADRRRRWRELLERHAHREWLDEPTAKRLLAIGGIRVPRGVVLSGPDDAALPEGLRAPYAVKIVSPDAIHKSDGGGVRLRVPQADVAPVIRDMAAAYRHARVDGYLVEEMADAGVELLLGGLVDPVFGPCVMLGGGGVQAELWQDVALRLCPVAPADVHAMIEELRIRPLLGGYRGAPGVDVDAVVAAVLALGGEDGLLMSCAGQIAAIDINPLIATPTGAVAVDARLQLRVAPATAQAPEAAPPSCGSLERLFAPAAIAVAGASTDGTRSGNHFIRNLRQYGYRGRIHVVHPSAREVDGLPAVAGFAELPEPVDYAYVAVPAPAVAPLLGAAGGKVGYAQVMTSGFAETAGGAQAQAELVAAARAGGVRVIGPNCLGLHSVRGRVTFIDGMGHEEGGLAVISQSGGLGVDILRRGQARGLAFSSLLTIGNAADLSVAELLEHHLQDPRVRQIALYVESLRDPAAVLAAIRRQQVRKPIVLLKGGTSAQGQAAAASHTGAIASDARLWTAFARQAGMATVQTLDGLIDACLALQCLRSRSARPTRRVALFGNGGGTSVLACDAFARAGFEVPTLAPAVLAQLQALPVPPGASLLNPVDTPVGALRVENGALAQRILAILTDAEDIDAVVLHLNLPVLLGYADEPLIHRLALAALDDADRDGGARPHVLLVLRSDTSEAVDALRRRLRRSALGAGVPVYDELADAAAALACLRDVERGDGGASALRPSL